MQAAFFKSLIKSFVGTSISNSIHLRPALVTLMKNVGAVADKQVITLLILIYGTLIVILQLTVKETVGNCAAGSHWGPILVNGKWGAVAEFPDTLQKIFKKYFILKMFPIGINFKAVEKTFTLIA